MNAYKQLLLRSGAGYFFIKGMTSVSSEFLPAAGYGPQLRSTSQL